MQDPPPFAMSKNTLRVHRAFLCWLIVFPLLVQGKCLKTADRGFALDNVLSSKVTNVIIFMKTKTDEQCDF